MSTKLNTPYGGKLVNLVVNEAERKELNAKAASMPSLQLGPRALCDLELIATGGFSPLSRFMGSKDYQRCIQEMRLADGHIFSIPVTLPIADPASVKLDGMVALRDQYYKVIAVMRVEEIYPWKLEEEAQLVYGTTDVAHPIVAEMTKWPKHYVSGELKVLELPGHVDFPSLRRTPVEVRAMLEKMGSSKVVAFQTRNPIHRAHEELTKRAAHAIQGSLLIHPVVGMTKPGDVDHYTRVRAYQALVDHHYDKNTTALSLLPLAMRMGGPREAVWHAIIRRNFGASHFIVGRDHAGPGKDSKGKPFYGPYDAQELLAKHAGEVGVEMVQFKQLVYLPDEDRYEEGEKVKQGTKTLDLSGTQVRDDYLAKGKQLPEWFTRPEVAKVLGDAYPPLNKQGFVVWFTGLPSSGKSTIANALLELLLERGRRVTVLDGDVVRTHLSKGLGFSKEDRDTNITRIGWVGAEIAAHGGAVICAAISPFKATRNQVRAMVKENFIETFVDTPVDACEQRDVKGLYAKARKGELKGFTGVDDPYEAPDNPELKLPTVGRTPVENAHEIIAYLEKRGFLTPLA